MKLSSTKPLSSPGRTDKFPPPLLRFLRSNVGSKSRGRSSRKSPTFFRRKSTTNIETQEPSSPKVTCMGQVRVKRSNNNKKNKNKNKPSCSKNTSTRKVQCCKCAQNARFCCLCTCKAKCLRPFWRDWRLCFGREVQTREDSSRFESKCDSQREVLEQENNGNVVDDDGNESMHESQVFAPANSFSPPKNALLLMRSRSAPYRSSSLASQFWGTHEENSEMSKSEKELKSKDSDQENEKKLDVFKELEGSVKERLVKSVNFEDSRTGDDSMLNSVKPLILTRCKSEPASRTSTRNVLDSEMVSWKKRRSDFLDSSSPHNL